MKKDIHPKGYRTVLFEDASSGTQFLIGSVVPTTDTGKAEDGKEYPKYLIETSSVSHPAYTGATDGGPKGGRVERFRARAAKKKG
jgi:large subunit ribosomal protein L31